MRYAKELYVLITLANNIPAYLINCVWLYALALLCLRKRLLSLFEPAHIYIVLSVTSFASFLLFHDVPGNTWKFELVAMAAAFSPFFLLYGRKREFRTQAGVLEGKSFSHPEAQLLAVIVSAIIIVQGTAVIIGSGFQIAGGGDLQDRLNLLKTSVLLTYTEPSAVTLVPPLLWILRSHRKTIFFLLFSMGIYTLKMIFLGSKASLIVPVLILFSYFFFRRLDSIALGKQYPPLYTQRSWILFGLGTAGIIGSAVAFYSAGAVAFGNDPSAAALSRLMLGFDGAIYTSVHDSIATNIPPYCVICSYAAFIKFFSTSLAPAFNNFGEYYGAYVLNFDYDKDPSARYLTLPNSTMPLEFLFSFGFPIAVLLIFFYSFFISSLMQTAELNRYKSILWLITFSYFMFNPVLYILDGANFVFGIYGAIVIYGLFVLGMFLIRLTGMSVAEMPTPTSIPSSSIPRTSDPHVRS